MITGVLLAQVGTPDAPTPAAVRRYLARFLSDRRVVDYPPWLWQPLLRLVILPLRAHRSARLYRRIWGPAGSPLLAISRRQRALLEAELGDRYRVVLGMAYAGPSFGDAIDELLRQGIGEVVVLPMFPQYSSATTASVYEAAFAAAVRTGRRARTFVPGLRFVAPYHDHPGYIAALGARVRGALAGAPAPDHVVVSFHGLPERYVRNGDPYRAHCERTLALLRGELGWPEAAVTLSFQSRFGPERWLSPDTAEVLRGLAGRGVRRPLVVTPGFTTDCLETLDELGHEGRRQFAEGGGDEAHYRLCPCLNDAPEWIGVMAELARGAPRSAPGTKP